MKRWSNELTLNVGAVILTPGLETMPGNIRPEYGYGRYPERGDQHPIRAHALGFRAFLRRGEATIGWEASGQSGLDPMRRLTGLQPW